MALWEWMLAVYQRPNVPEACLELQDAFGQNAPLLLWAAWARPSDPLLLGRAAATARSWEEAAVRPLRMVRRALKAPFPPVADAAREGLRMDVKAAELHAERVLVEALEALNAGRAGCGPALEAMRAAARAWGRPAPDHALAALDAALA